MLTRCPIHATGGRCVRRLCYTLSCGWIALGAGGRALVALNVTGGACTFYSRALIGDWKATCESKRSSARSRVDFVVFGA